MVLQSHFGPQEFPTAMSTIVMFDFVGVASLPMVLQYLRNQYGLQNSLIIFGAVVWNTLVMGVAAKHPPGYGTVSDSDKHVHLSNGNQEQRNKHFELVHKISSEITSFSKHKQALIILLIESISQYLFVSWALFLVPVGKSLGLSEFQAVTLSTFGGIGGFFGRLLATFLFWLDKMNAVTSSLVPILVTGLMLVLTVVSKDYYVISGVVFASGMSQAVTSSGMFGLISTTVCPHHYRIALAAECCLGGFAMQFAGLISGNYVTYLCVIIGLISKSTWETKTKSSDSGNSASHFY